MIFWGNYCRNLKTPVFIFYVLITEIYLTNIWGDNWRFSIWCRKRTLLITIIGKNQSKSQEITWFCPFFNGNLRNCHQLPTLTPWFTFSFLCKVRVNKVFQIFTWKEKKNSYIFPFFQLTNIKNSPNRTCNRIRIHKNRSQWWL